MPSTIIGAQSGGVPLWSGNLTLWSGSVVSGSRAQAERPVGGLQLLADYANSGTVFIGFSGGVTMRSGGGLASGGLLDGFPLPPGGTYFPPKLVLRSGMWPTLWVTCGTTTSGYNRVFWEPF